MKKRFLSIVLSICLALTLVPNMVYAETNGDFTCSVSDDKVTITRDNGSAVSIMSDDVAITDEYQEQGSEEQEPDIEDTDSDTPEEIGSTSPESNLSADDVAVADEYQEQGSEVQESDIEDTDSDTPGETGSTSPESDLPADDVAVADEYQEQGSEEQEPGIEDTDSDTPEETGSTSPESDLSADDVAVESEYQEQGSEVQEPDIEDADGDTPEETGNTSPDSDLSADDVLTDSSDTSTRTESDTVDSEAVDEYSINALELEGFLGSPGDSTLKTDMPEGKSILPSAPTSVVLHYGDVIEKAELSGQTGNGTWDFEEPDYVPSYEDYKNGKTFEMKFTPYDTASYRSYYADVKITELKKKPITVYIDDKEMTYGEEIPELTFSFDEDLLVGEDTVYDLKIKLDFDKDYSTSGRLKAGQYIIKGSSESDRYDVSFSSRSEYNGSLWVYRKLLDVEWTDTRNLLYTGEPLTVRATISGFLSGDDCSYAMISGEHEIGPSYTEGTPVIYEAVVDVTGADRLNYVLPEDDDDKEYQTSIKYYIRRNIDTECNFPTKVVLTYGQKLWEATLIGESRAEGGRFAFVKMDERHIILEYIDDEIPEPGDYSYKMVYFPPYTDIPSCWGEVSVTVYKKTITITADDKEKAFGDDTPELTYTVDGTPLVGEDKISDLGISLTAGEGDDKFCDVGNYKITLASTVSSDKYHIKIKPGRLTVAKKKIFLNWPAGNEFIYNGEAVNVYAEAVLPDGLPEKAQCGVIVIGGKRTNAGSYTARAIAVDNPNYKLSEDARKTFNYTIKKCIPSVVSPESAAITYGQTLSQAVLEGGSSSVPGKFVFTERTEEFPEVSDSGSRYGVKFVPDDSENYMEILSIVGGKKITVPVTVKPKSINISAYNQYKEYGQDTPELSWYIDESSLVGTDSADDFDIELTAGEGDDKYCDVGGYDIKLSKAGIIRQNPNYTVNFIGGRLEVNPKKIMVNAIPGEKIYGEETILDFELDEENVSNKLVGDDTKKDLDVVLTAVSTDEENTSDGDGIRSPVGVYEIRLKACGSSNYDVTVTPAQFRIRSRIVKLIWTDDTELQFNGEPVHITARAEGVLPEDECFVNIVNGDRTQPGTYIAQAVSLTNDNYELPEDRSLLIKQYSIIDTSSGEGGDEEVGETEDEEVGETEDEEVVETEDEEVGETEDEEVGETDNDKGGVTEDDKGGVTEDDKVGETEDEEVGETDDDKGGETDDDDAGNSPGRENNSSDTGKGFVSNETGSVETGDMIGDTFVLFMILLGASFAVMLATVIYRKRPIR